MKSILLLSLCFVSIFLVSCKDEAAKNIERISDDEVVIRVKPGMKVLNVVFSTGYDGYQCRPFKEGENPEEFWVVPNRTDRMTYHYIESK